MNINVLIINEETFCNNLPQDNLRHKSFEPNKDTIIYYA